MRFLFISVAVLGIRGRTPQSTRTVPAVPRAASAGARARAPARGRERRLWARPRPDCFWTARTRVTTGRGPGLYHVEPCTVRVARSTGAPCLGCRAGERVPVCGGEARHVCVGVDRGPRGRATRWAVAVRKVQGESASICVLYTPYSPALGLATLLDTHAHAHAT